MTIDLQLASVDMPDVTQVPCSATIDRWVTEIFLALNHPPENLTVRVVGEAEMSELNQHYRAQNKPTNVLAFPFQSVAEVNYPYLGDIVICFAVVQQESKQQDKPIQSHFAHMVIHGTLHLCGFDHQTDDQAIAMESMEKNILAKIGMA